MRALIAAAAGMAAAVVLVACGGQSVTFSQSSTVPTVPVATGGSPATTGASSTPRGSNAAGGTGTSTASVPIDRLVGPQGINFEANPVLAPTPTNLTGATIDGIQCQTLRQLAYQANSHLQVYVDGSPRGLPGGIGMVDPAFSQTQTGPTFTSSHCYYWLHTLTQDGVIHAESPIRRTFTLGQLFAIWHQPLSRDRVGPARGAVTAIVDGHRFSGAPRLIPLTEHSTIELAVGTPVPTFKAVDWSTSGL